MKSKINRFKTYKELDKLTNRLQIVQQIKSQINRSKFRSTDPQLDPQIKSKINRSNMKSTDQKFSRPLWSALVIANYCSLSSCSFG